ncbi:MAG: DMT family transporter [Pelagimonas sp.]|nr:DMT family transporter [Pelagimonas sp.]
MTRTTTRMFQNMPKPLAGALLMVSAGALFAVVNTLIQYGTMTMGLAPSRVAFWQYLVAFVVALPWLLKGGKGAWHTAHPLQHLLRVGFAVIGVQLWVYGLAFVPIWQAIALIMLSPFFVTIGAGLFLGEPIPAPRWLAVVLGFAGGMIILAPWSDAFSLHALFPVGAALFWALTSLATKRMTTTESSQTLTFYLLLLLTPTNAVLALGDGLALGVNSANLALLFAAGTLTAIAQFFIARSYSLADAAFLQPFDHVKLPFNVGLGLIVFGWAPPGSLWLGATLIIGASLYLLHQETRAQTA